MKRGGPIKRRGWLRRKPRTPAEKDRIYGLHSGWCKRQGSHVARRPEDRTVVVAHHTKNGGTGRKADARWIVPLTWLQHTDLHTMGPTRFAKKYGVDIDWHETALSYWQRSPYNNDEREAA